MSHGADPTAHDILIELLGAVALLLWGMRMVRTGVQRAFGAELRHLLRVSLRNRFAALLAGIGVTGVLQSSTATAFVVASFAGRGLVETARRARGDARRRRRHHARGPGAFARSQWLAPVMILAGVVVYLARRSLALSRARPGRARPRPDASGVAPAPGRLGADPRRAIVRAAVRRADPRTR